MTMKAGALGNAIRAHRSSARMTLAELAEKLDISVNHMQRIESGKSLPSVPVLYELARVLNFSVDDAFFGNAGNKESAARRALQRRVAMCGEREIRVLLAAANALLEK